MSFRAAAVSWPGALRMLTGRPTASGQFDASDLALARLRLEDLLNGVVLLHAEALHHPGVVAHHDAIAVQGLLVQRRRLRKALGGPHQQLIQTVRGTGYRFSAKV